MSSAIEVAHLPKRFGKVAALDEVSFDVAPGAPARRQVLFRPLPEIVELGRRHAEHDEGAFAVVRATRN